MRFFAKSLANVLVAAGLFLAGGCADEPTVDEVVETPEIGGDSAVIMEQEEVAIAELQPTEGNNVTGTVQFIPVDEGVRVVADIRGLEPGEHGFHIHEFGDCSAPDASSAGGHYAPQGSPHGAPTDPVDQRHMGDLGNLVANQGGEAHYEHVDEVLSLSGPNSIVGKAVIVHGGQDDLESQPAGNAGPRMACGVIQMAGTGAGAPADTTMASTPGGV